MPSVKDVAQYILEQKGTMSTIKLQKLVYYCQAWSLVWNDAPLFPEKIEAWANGPVVVELFRAHQGEFHRGAVPPIGDSSQLTQGQKEIIDNVLPTYADKTPQWLVELTHLESPWIEARAGLPAGVRSHNEITLASIANYYSGLLTATPA